MSKTYSKILRMVAVATFLGAAVLFAILKLRGFAF